MFLYITDEIQKYSVYLHRDDKQKTSLWVIILNNA